MNRIPCPISPNGIPFLPLYLPIRNLFVTYLNFIATLVGILIYSSVIRNEALRVAFIHIEESGATDGKISKEFYSKLVKADIHGKDQVNDGFCWPCSFFIDLHILSRIGFWVFISPHMLPISISESKMVITSVGYTLACHWWTSWY